MSSLRDRDEAVWWMTKFNDFLKTGKAERPTGYPYSFEEVLQGVESSRAIETAILSLRGKVCLRCRKPVDDSEPRSEEIGGLALCGRHRDELWQIVNEIADRGVLGRTEIMEEMRARETLEVVREHLITKEVTSDSAISNVVYYILVDPGAPTRLVKIGTTQVVSSRIRAHRTNWPFMSLLAIEPGGRDTEKERHNQFRHLLCPKSRELFFDCGEIRRHIERLS